jgi:hypothetical protein
MVARLLDGETDAVRRAKEWVREARHVVSEVVLETIESSVDRHHQRKRQHRPRRGDRGSDPQRVLGEGDAEREELFESWCKLSSLSTLTEPSIATTTTTTATDPDPEDRALSEWSRVISYCDSLSSWRRPGEGQVVRWWDFALVGWTRRLGKRGNSRLRAIHCEGCCTV